LTKNDEPGAYGHYWTQPPPGNERAAEPSPEQRTDASDREDQSELERGDANLGDEVEDEDGKRHIAAAVVQHDRQHDGPHQWLSPQPDLTLLGFGDRPAARARGRRLLSVRPR